MPQPATLAKAKRGAMDGKLSTDAPRILQSPAGMYFHIADRMYVSLMAIASVTIDVEQNTGVLATVDGKTFLMDEKACELWEKVSTPTPQPTGPGLAIAGGSLPPLRGI